MFDHFPDYSPFSREKQHVLMSIDVQKSDGVAWVKAYGKGRTYFTPLGAKLAPKKK